MSYRRSQVGSAASRIDSIVELQNNDIVNLNYKNSLIKDSDIAIESTNLAHAQILQQVSSSLFAQANSMNGALALRLLGI